MNIVIGLCHVDFSNIDTFSESQLKQILDLFFSDIFINFKLEFYMALQICLVWWEAVPSHSSGTEQILLQTLQTYYVKYNMMWNEHLGPFTKGPLSPGLNRFYFRPKIKFICISISTIYMQNLRK